jgi:hypothetical protein
MSGRAGCRAVPMVMLHALACSFGALFAAHPAAAQRGATELAVPRTSGASVDARLAPGEWDGAAVAMLSDGAELRAQHDGRFLYLALRATMPGFPSVCVTDGDAGDVVHVLHASASLGHAVYRRDGAQWSVRTPFSFGLRTREDTPEARAERASFLREQGWVATTMYLGDGMQKEMQLPITFLGGQPRIAIAYMRDTPTARGPSAFWPAGLRDGCGNPQLVRGFAVPHPRFEPARWVRLTLSW